LPIEGIDLPGVLKSRELLNFSEIPNRLIIIGGGVIGVEFAAIFNSLGAKVTIIEALPQVFPQLIER
jgi:dihydrolipoamide dehydrogenase